MVLHEDKFPILKYFAFDHLKSEPMRATSKKFHDLAVNMASTLPFNAETTTCLRKLLESKDCAVRSLL